MIDYLMLIALTVLFSYVIENRTYKFDTTREGIRYDGQSKFLYIIILATLILFSGLRSKYNDTATYMQGFQLLDANSIKISDVFLPYGGFDVYQKLIKTYLGANPQWLIFVSAVVTNVLYMSFIVRHAEYFCGSMMLYMIGSYSFCLAGIKQGIAIGIALHAIDAYFKRKYIRAALLLLVAMTFHPYIICLICIPFLKNRLWDTKTLFIVFIAVVLFTNLESLFTYISLLGKDYSMETWDNYTINPMRVLVESIPIILSYVYRNKINNSKDEILILGTNMRLISFTFLAMGLFFNPIYLGRMSSYFSALSVMTIPKMLRIIFDDKQNRKLFILGYYAFFFVYFLLDMTKLGSISIFTDQFSHVSLFSLF